MGGASSEESEVTMDPVLEVENAQRPPCPSRSRVAAVLLGIILLVHLIQCVRIFPTPQALLDNQHPVLLVDHAIHLYHGALGSQFLREHGTTWGIDPFFMAGYPETPVWDSSSNLSILFQFLAGGGYHPQAYNLGLFVCSILVLLFIPVGAKAAGIRFNELVMATLLAWLYCHSEWADMLWRSGLFAFVTASAASTLFCGVLLGYDRNPTRWRWVELTLVSAILCYIHVTAPFVVIGAVVGFGLATLRRHHWRWRLSLVTAAGLALAANLFWIIPLLWFSSIRTPQLFFMAPDTAWYLVGQYLTPNLDGPLSLFILIFGLIGLLSWGVQGEWTRAATYGGAGLVCLALALFGGGYALTQTLEPLRFKVPVHLLLSVPAGSALLLCSSWLSRKLGGGRRGPLLVGVAWFIALATFGAFVPRSLAILKEQLLVERPVVAGFKPEMLQLVTELKERTDPSARILFEDQLRLHELRDPESTHWTPLLPYLLGNHPRQFIGGLYHMAFISHHKTAAFGDFHLGGHPIESWSSTDLRNYCDQYNVGWVVCWSPLSRFTFDHWSGAEKVATLPRYHSKDMPVSMNPNEWNYIGSRVGPDRARELMLEGGRYYHVYRVDRPRSFFLVGEGQIDRADFNRLEMSGLKPSQGELVLSMHWFDTWRSEPPVKLEPVQVPGDPVPFVRLISDQPIEKLTLYNGYER